MTKIPMVNLSTKENSGQDLLKKHHSHFMKQEVGQEKVDTTMQVFH